MSLISTPASLESAAPTDSRLAALCAETVQRAILKYEECFHAIALRLAESFFNSLTRRVFATEGVDQAIEFVDTDFDEAPTTGLEKARRIYRSGSISELLHAALTDPAVGFAEEYWSELPGTVRLGAER